MKAVLVLLCLGLALATEAPPESGLYQIKNKYEVTSSSAQGNEFVYYYDGQVMTGIPQTSGQRAGTRIQAVVLVYPTPGDKWTIALKHVKFGSIDQRIPFKNQNRILPFDMFEDATIEDEAKQHLEQPFEVHRTDGIIEEVKFKPNEQEWVKNLKRGILNLLSFDRLGKSADHFSRYCQLPGRRDCADKLEKMLNQGKSLFYSKPEITVEGNCRVDYTIVPSQWQAPSWNVSKVVDHSDCYEYRRNPGRPFVAQNFHLSDSCPGCETLGLKGLNGTTAMTLNCYGQDLKNCVIERAGLVSVYTVPSLTDEPGNTIRAKVNQSLVLVNIVPKQAPSVTGVQKERVGMLYSLMWDDIKEKFQLLGQDGPWKNLQEYAKWGKNKVNVCIAILRKIGEDTKARLSSPPRMETPGRFAQLVRVIRGMTLSELNTLHQKAYVNNVPGLTGADQNAVKDILHSAIGAAGTLPALQHIDACIGTKLTDPIRIVSTLKQLQNAKEVSAPMMDKMMALCEKLESSKPQYQVCLLSLGSMIRARCQPRGNMLAMIQDRGYPPVAPLRCNNPQRMVIMKYFENKLTKSEEDRFPTNIAVIKALGNTAFVEMTPIIQKVIHDFEYSEEVRTQAVLALKSLKEINTKVVQQVCLPITLNRRMEPSIRVACAHVVLSSDPEMPELLTLINQINRRWDSRIVKSFIYSQISGLANSTTSMSNPCTKRVAMRARQVLRLVNDNEKVLTSSFTSRLQLFSSKQPYGMEWALESLGSNSSFIPAILAMRVGGSFMGFNVPEVFSVALQSKALDKVIVSLLSQGIPESYSRPRRSTLSSLKDKLKEITESESLKVEDARLLAYMRIMGQEAGAVTLDRNIMEWLINQYKAMSNDQLKQEFNLHLASIFSETMLKMPTALGLPIVLRTSTPMLFQAKGSFGVHNTGSHYVKDMKIMPTIMSKQDVTVEIWSPVVNTGVKLSQRYRLSVPLVGSVSKQGVVEVKMPEDNFERYLLTVSAEPLCFRRKWYEADEDKYVYPVGEIITSKHHSRVRNWAKEVKVLGMTFKVKAHHSQSPYEQSASFPLVPPTAGPSSFSISAKSECKAIKITPEYESSRMVQGELKSKVHTIQTNEDPREPPFTIDMYNKKQLTLQAECSEGSSYFRKLKLAYKVSPGSRLRHLEAQVYSDKSGPPMYCAEAEVLYPAGPIRNEDLSSSINSRFIYAWGPNCKTSQTERRVSIEMQSDVSEKKKDIYNIKNLKYRQCLTDGSPVECYHVFSEVKHPDVHRIMIKYKDVRDEIKNITQKLLTRFTASHISNADINKYAQNPANVIKAKVEIDPVTYAQQNVTIKEPGQTIKYQDIQSPLLSSPNAMVMRIFRPSTYVAQCLVADRIIKSFDGLRFRAPVTDCWSVLAKDCTPQDRFAILLKKKNSGDSKVLGIMSKNKFVEVEREGDFRVKVDGAVKTIPDTDNKMASVAGKEVYVQKYGDKKIKITLPEQEVSVYFDGKAASIKISAAYFTGQCGLCGHYNREADDVLRSNKEESQTSVLQFFQSYQLALDGCQQVSDNDASNYHIGYENIKMEGDRPQLNRGSSRPLQLRRGQYHSGRYCVTSEQHPTCPIGSTPIEKEQQNVDFTCFRSSYKAHSLAQKITQQQQIPERDVTTDSDDDFTVQLSISLPERCVYH